MAKGNDLAKLTSEERAEYYNQVCSSLGLNPLTKPLDYINLSGKLTLYAKKDCTDQLRSIRNISITETTQLQMGDIFVVNVKASTPEGRTDADTGAVSTTNLRGEALANALMKAITKAKRRVTLSICGLGFLDETEVETIPDAKPVRVDIATGEVQEDDPTEKERCINSIAELQHAGGISGAALVGIIRQAAGLGKNVPVPTLRQLDVTTLQSVETALRGIAPVEESPADDPGSAGDVEEI
jgi:hypothetical protein